MIAIGRALIALLLVSMAGFVAAESDFLDVLTAKYKIAEGSKLAEKSCGICHVSDSDFSFNAYGHELKEKLEETHSKSVTPEILDAVANEDADGDGITNGAELAAGSLPGTADNATGKPAIANHTDSDSKPAPVKPSQVMPKNAFHPAIVHFPIALLIAGLLLDVIGLVGKQKMFLFAGWYNLVLAAIASLAAVASGFVAMTLMKLPYKGLILTHLMFALAVTIIMWMMVSLRVHRHEQMNIPVRILYYALALSAFAIISWTGHLGGVFVYGE